MAGPQDSQRVLKAHSQSGQMPSAAYNFEDLRKRCETYLEEVQAKARQMITEASAKVESIRQAAYDEGFKAGQIEGMSQANARIQKEVGELSNRQVQERILSAMPALEAAATVVAEDRDLWMEQWNTSAVELAAAIAGKLIQKEIELHPDAVKDLMSEALRMVQNEQHFIVKLHPEDVTIVGSQAENMRQSLVGLGQIQVVEDASLERGDCVIETRNGTIDGQLETRLNRIVDELTGRAA
ncbi:FliH/SctL family protein [Calycomorphotria hydatis]|uniref:Flagellar assembly protein FliH n=1 Tax=Calycomorphotria hydatis TaxID=2528027 RepID=A0A517TB97_9PLAN|nr:FliH/SctL family protein [Calycomorphotria hydatis]QDT65649.1 Yop proteins translocation protein L [Calycomorphotria hydatis]